MRLTQQPCLAWALLLGGLARFDYSGGPPIVQTNPSAATDPRCFEQAGICQFSQNRSGQPCRIADVLALKFDSGKSDMHSAIADNRSQRYRLTELVGWLKVVTEEIAHPVAQVGQRVRSVILTPYQL